MKQKTYYYEVSGTHKEIGKQLAKIVDVQKMVMPLPPFITKKDIEEAIKLYEKYCPGLMEELTGFAEEGKVQVKDLAYFWMTYLVPRCSGMAILGSKMIDGHTKLVRNYEFGLEEEDLAVCQIHVEGKYKHIGGTSVVFGRTEGINECGLAVAMSSCGIPVSNIEGMRPSQIKGLQFWAVIRSLLDHCKDVEEALEMAQEMPIAFNLNLYLADAKGNVGLLETINGHKAYKKISEATLEKYVYGTNHIVLPELQVYEPVGMRNSIVRYEKMTEFLESHDQLSETQVKEFLLQKYPEGPTCYYYSSWFGTIKSVVMDPIEKRFSICWLGHKENGWEDYVVGQPMESMEKEKLVTFENATPDLFEMIPIPTKDREK